MRLQIAIWKLSHNKNPDVPKPSEENHWTKNNNEVLKRLCTTRDILPTNLTDTLDHQNGDENDELDLNDDTRWDSDDCDKETDCGVDSDDKLDDLMPCWFKIVANVFQDNTNFVYKVINKVLCSKFKVHK